MPLMKGHSAQVVSSNIKEMVRSGYKPKQAIAASLANARKYRKMASGGEVQSYEHGGMEDMEPFIKADHGKGGKNESMAEMDSKGPEDYMRGLNEIREDGEYYPDEVANPNEMQEAQGYAMALKRQVMSKPGPENYAYGGSVDGLDMEQMQAKRFAMGGLVQDGPEENYRLNGTRPEEGDSKGFGMDSTRREDASSMPLRPDGLEHPKMNDPSGMGLSEEAKKAIAMKKKARKYGMYDPRA